VRERERERERGKERERERKRERERERDSERKRWRERERESCHCSLAAIIPLPGHLLSLSCLIEEGGKELPILSADLAAEDPLDIGCCIST
jgi:hypothetical protein